MKKLKVLPRLIVAAIMAMAFAAPAAASAADWTIDGEPLTEPAVIELDGYMRMGITNPYMGFRCYYVHGEATLTPGGSGELTSIDLNPQFCEGEGALNDCTMKSHLTPAIWDLTATSTPMKRIALSTVGYQWSFSDNCGLRSATLIGGQGLSAYPDDSGFISSLLISGNYSFNNGGASGTIAEFEVTPPGVYGISD